MKFKAGDVIGARFASESSEYLQYTLICEVVFTHVASQTYFCMVHNAEGIDPKKIGRALISYDGIVDELTDSERKEVEKVSTFRSVIYCEIDESEAFIIQNEDEARTEIVNTLKEELYN